MRVAQTQRRMTYSTPIAPSPSTSYSIVVSSIPCTLPVRPTRSSPRVSSLISHREQPLTLKPVQESKGVLVSAESQHATNTQLDSPEFPIRNELRGDAATNYADHCSDEIKRVTGRDGMAEIPPLTDGVFVLDRPLRSPSPHTYTKRATKDRNLQSNDSVDLSGGEAPRRVTTAPIFERSLASIPVELSVNERGREQKRKRLWPASGRVEHQRAKCGGASRLVGGSGGRPPIAGDGRPVGGVGWRNVQKKL